MTLIDNIRSKWGLKHPERVDVVHTECGEDLSAQGISITAQQFTQE